MRRLPLGSRHSKSTGGKWQEDKVVAPGSGQVMVYQVSAMVNPEAGLALLQLAEGGRGWHGQGQNSLPGPATARIARLD